MKVMVCFRLFAAKKNQTGSSQVKKKMWGTVNSSRDVPVIVTVEVTSFKDFQSEVISACNTHFPGAGPVLLKGLTAQPQAIYWYGSIARCPNYAKKDNIEISSSSKYRDRCEEHIILLRDRKKQPHPR